MRYIISTLLLASSLAHAASVPVVGQSIRITDTPIVSHRRTYSALVDPAVDLTGLDPTATGATLDVYSTHTGHLLTVALPAGGWTVFRTSKTVQYRFKAADVQVRLIDDKLIRISSRGGSAYDLGFITQSAITVRLTIDGTAFCSVFGGQRVKDDGKTFSARNAPAPATCPPAPGASTTTTTTVTTTTETETTTTATETTTTETATTTTETETTTTDTSTTETTTTESTTTTTLGGPLMGDFGPMHTFEGLTTDHFITQGCCSVGCAGDNDVDAAYFCTHFYGANCTPQPGYSIGILPTPTTPKMHKNGGCTGQGTDIAGTTCDSGPCKIGNWSETTSGLVGLVCHCS